MLQLQDFGASLSIFKRKLIDIEQSIENYDELIRSLNTAPTDAEISALRSISCRYYSETVLLKNRYENIEHIELFCSSLKHQIVIMFQK